MKTNADLYKFYNSFSFSFPDSPRITDNPNTPQRSSSFSDVQLEDPEAILVPTIHRENQRTIIVNIWNNICSISPLSSLIILFLVLLTSFTALSISVCWWFWTLFLFPISLFIINVEIFRTNQSKRDIYSENLVVGFVILWSLFMITFGLYIFTKYGTFTFSSKFKDSPELCVSQIRAKEGQIIEPHKIHCIPNNCIFGQLHIDPPLPETIRIDSHTNTLFGEMSLNYSSNYEITMHCGWIVGFEAKTFFSIIKEDSFSASIDSKLDMIVERLQALSSTSENFSRKIVREENCTCPNNSPPFLLTLVCIGLLSWLFHKSIPFVIVHFAEKRE